MRVSVPQKIKLFLTLNAFLLTRHWFELTWKTSAIMSNVFTVLNIRVWLWKECINLRYSDPIMLKTRIRWSNTRDRTHVSIACSKHSTVENNTGSRGQFALNFLALWKLACTSAIQENYRLTLFTSVTKKSVIFNDALNSYTSYVRWTTGFCEFYASSTNIGLKCYRINYNVESLEAWQSRKLHRNISSHFNKISHVSYNGWFFTFVMENNLYLFWK